MHRFWIRLVRRRTYILATSVAFISFVLFVVFHPLWLTKIAEFLVVETPLEASDVIIILDGGTERLESGIALYKQGYASHILLKSGGDAISLGSIHIKWEAIIKLELASKQIPDDVVIFADSISESTYEEAINTLGIMKKHSFKSAILVSSPYHMRRVRMIFNKIYKGTGIKLSYSPAKNGWFSSERWWTRENDLVTVNNEYIKLMFYHLKY